MQQARDDAAGLLGALMRLHLAIARVSRIDVLIGMYQTTVVTLSSTMTRAGSAPQAEELHQHNLDLHRSLVAAIREKVVLALEEVLALHSHDMERLV